MFLFLLADALLRQNVSTADKISAQSCRFVTKSFNVEQETKLNLLSAAPAGTNASPSAASTPQYPTAPTPPTFYNPNAVGAPPAPSPGLASIPQQVIQYLQPYVDVKKSSIFKMALI